MNPLSITLVLFVALGAGLQGDPDGRAFVYFTAEHLEAVRAEREAELQHLYLAAPEARRAAATRALEQAGGGGRPALRPPGFDVLARARRALLDEQPPADALQELADSLDLRVAPGLFAAREEGLGEALTVTVSRLWRAPSLDARMSLWWIDEAGQRSNARVEPVGARAFERGFEMYIRPPRSSAGRWHLGLELEADARSVRGLAVPVDCVSDLDALKDSARGTDPFAREGTRGAGAAGVAFLRRLELLERFGLRSGSLLPLAEQLAILRREPGARARVVPTSDVRGAVVFELAGRDGAEPRRRALLVASSPERPAIDELAGATGAAWRDLARDGELRVFVAGLPPERREAEPWLELCAELARSEQLDELTLVAVGELALLLPRALERADSCPLDSLVLAASPATRVAPRREEPGVPLLLVDGGAARAAESSGASATWTRLERVAADLFLAPELPALIAEWLARE